MSSVRLTLALLASGLLTSTPLGGQPASANTLCLQESLKLSLQNNLNLEIAQAQIQTAEWDLALNQTKRFPRVSLAAYSGIAQFNGGIPLANNLIFETKVRDHAFLHGELGVQASYLLFDNGQRALEEKEKRNKLHLTETRLEAAQSDILFRTATAYCKAYHAQERIRRVQKTLQLLRDLQSCAGHYRQVGLMSESALVKIETQIHDFEDLMDETRYIFLENIVTLKSNVNLPAESTVTTDSLSCLDHKRLLQLFSAASEPDANLRLQTAKLLSHQRALYLQRARKHNSMRLHLNSFFRYSTLYSWNIGIGLSWPLLDFGETRALTRMAQADYTVSELQVKALEKEVSQASRLSYERMLLSYRRLRSINERLSARAKALAANGHDEPSQSIETRLMAVQQELAVAELVLKKSEREEALHVSCLDYLRSTNRMQVLLEP